MKKIGYFGIILATSAAGLMTYALINKKTSNKANQLVNDMLSKTDDLIRGK